MILTKIIALAFKRPVRVLLKLSACCGSLLIAQLLFVCYCTAQVAPNCTGQVVLYCHDCVVVYCTAPAPSDTTHHGNTRPTHTMIAEIKKRGFKSIVKINRFSLYIFPTYLLPQRQSHSLSLLSKDSPRIL